jgi:hypothetical protein
VANRVGRPRDENQSKILYTNGLGEKFRPIQAELPIGPADSLINAAKRDASRILTFLYE